MKNQVCTLLFLILFPIIIYTQPLWERRSTLPQENTINDICRIPGTSKLIAVGEGSTFLISPNNGVSWDIYSNPADLDNLYQAYGAYFINSNEGFIYGGKETILKTNDEGISWNVEYNGNSNYNWQFINEVEFINENLGFAVGDNGLLLKTINAGLSWSEISLGLSANLNVLEFTDEQTGFIYSNTNAYLKTIDGGTNWDIEYLPSSIESLVIKDVLYNSTEIGLAIGIKFEQQSEVGKIYKTIDGGVSWVEVFSDDNGWYWPQAIDFKDEDHGMVSFNAIMYGCINYTTNDGGDTWEETPMFTYSWAPCRDLHFDDDKAIVVGNMGLMSYSIDEGENWNQYSERQVYGEISDLQFTNDETAFLSAKNETGGALVFEMYKSQNGGQDWSFNNLFIQHFVFDFIDDEIGFVATEDIDLTVYKTENGAQDWTPIYLSEYHFEPTCIRFSDELNGIICGEDIIIKTSDGGENWETINTGYPDNGYSDIEFQVSGDVFICGNNSIFKSEDGGISWDQHSFGSNYHFSDIYIKNENTIFITGRDTIFRSDDNGDTWAGVNINNPNTISFQSMTFPTSDIGYAVGHGTFETIIKTIDGGDNWEVLNTNSTSGLNAVHFFDENNGLAMGENGLVLRYGESLQLNPPENFTLDTGYDLPQTIFYLQWDTPDLSNTPELLSYNIYRNDSLLLNVGLSNYYEEALYPIGSWGSEVCYYITALYNSSEGESAPTEELCGGWLTKITQPKLNKISFSYQPNPFNNYVQIAFSQSNIKEGELLIYNQSGQIVMQNRVKPEAEQVSIPTEKLKSGIYFFQLKSDNEILDTRKLIKI